MAYIFHSANTGYVYVIKKIFDPDPLPTVLQVLLFMFLLYFSCSFRDPRGWKEKRFV
jgi:hypothetical protein